jgi:hypothetical protein
MFENTEEVSQISNQDCIEAYEVIKTHPDEMFTSSKVRELYAQNFQNDSCPTCGNAIKKTNHQAIGEIDYLICERDGCWTLAWISRRPLEGSAYGVTFSSDTPITKLQAAKLAVELCKIANSNSVEFPMSVDSDMFPAIEESGQGHFIAYYIPLTWEFGYEAAEYGEVIDHLLALSFEERVADLLDRVYSRLADYGWRDQEDYILSSMSAIQVEGCSFNVSVGEFFDSEVQLYK